ncbi:hypothetical protein ACIQCQ_38610 [Streptomyces sp. NPDC088394]|uniref:hypothetical protein n=1 Tax=Streptomyces sp. NPDC088394 TaxID=3365860 RepID=UPI003805750C
MLPGQKAGQRPLFAPTAELPEVPGDLHGEGAGHVLRDGLEQLINDRGQAPGFDEVDHEERGVERVGAQSDRRTEGSLMPRRGERKPRVRSSAPEPEHIGIRTVTWTRRGVKARRTVDPAKYRCRTLAAQLADEWITYTRAMARSDGGVDLAQAVRSFAKFVDRLLPTLGMDPANVRLDGHEVDLVEVIHAWEEDLRQQHGLRSNSPM